MAYFETKIAQTNHRLDCHIIAPAESTDFIVQIRIIQEVRRMTEVARVEKELRNGRP